MMVRAARTIALAACFLLVSAAAAVAATSPTVKVSSPTSVKTDSATLNGSIDPNGSATVYRFVYGPTTALGVDAPLEKLAAGTATKSVSTTISGLLPGTTYYYQLQASNGAGGTSSTVHHFKTAGPPPPGAATGGVSAISKNSATLTGVVEPNHATTSYYFVYGPTTSYGMQTPTETVAAGTQPVPVSAALSGLASGTVFHYQLIVVHTGVAPSGGGDQSFETYPSPTPKPRVSARTSPRKEIGGPYTFTTNGTVHNKTSTSAALACTGSVTIRFFYGRRQVAVDHATLGSTCRFSAVTKFAHKPRRSRKAEKLKIKLRFEGNGYLAASSAGNETVMLG